MVRRISSLGKIWDWRVRIPSGQHSRIWRSRDLERDAELASIQIPTTDRGEAV